VFVVHHFGLSAGPRTYYVNVIYRLTPCLRAVVDQAAEKGVGCRDYANFFAQLSYQGSIQRLTILDVAADDIPASRICLSVSGALSKKDVSVSF